ncbi:MAG TPA: hypothetical protein PKI81_12000 [bacterium]|jgi:hypothetical protein|nr:hypothetical protein [bacterium]HOZ20755.1 hypothetical protein [bacterium]
MWTLDFFEKSVALYQKIFYISAMAEIACRFASLPPHPPKPEQTRYRTRYRREQSRGSIILAEAAR